MDQSQVINRIKALGEQILPKGASLWLYGSRARGDARPDSDYDLLILLDKDKISMDDYDSYVIPLAELGLSIDTEINSHVYPRKEWTEWDFVPFHDNVEQEKMVLQ